MAKETLTLTGMSCGHCVSAVRSALEELPGVEVESITIGSATVNYDPARTSTDAIDRALEEEGYPVASREQIS